VDRERANERLRQLNVRWVMDDGWGRGTSMSRRDDRPDSAYSPAALTSNILGLCFTRMKEILKVLSMQKSAIF